MAAPKEKIEKDVPEEIEETSPAEKKVTIKLPRLKENNGPLFVSVNERTFLIQRGVPVDVPECVAEVIAEADRLEEMADEYDLARRK